MTILQILNYRCRVSNLQDFDENNYEQMFYIGQVTKESDKLGGIT